MVSTGCSGDNFGQKLKRKAVGNGLKWQKMDVNPVARLEKFKV